MAARRARAFDACHAAVPATLLAGTVALCMLAVEPVLAAISLAGALLFSLIVRGTGSTARGLVWELPLLALVCLANPLFSASGSTLLFKLGPRSVYLESLAYGATMGALLVAVVLWLQCAAAVLTQDRLLALAPRRARAVPLLLGMVAQLAPQLLRRSHDVRAALAACTAAGPRPGARDALVRTSSLLLTWSLEESLERADSMRARGWESGRSRSAYRPERLRRRDALMLVGITALLALAAACAWALCARWRFYPRLSAPAPWWAYVPSVLLALLPAAAELAARLHERGTG